MTSDAAIRVDDVSFTYAGGKAPAIRNVSFEIARGEIFGFLGPSGAGKSTMQKVLMRLLQGHTGQVEALGRRLRDWGADYYERIGVCFELPTNYRKLTARENLGFFSALYDGETYDSGTLLDLVGLGDDADKRVEQFSKGMQIRLNFARALLHRPTLLFLDEPTAGLDPANARRIRGLIREQQASGTTVFLTTHDMAVADELCDRVAFIVEGALGVVEAPATLKQQHGRAQRARRDRGRGRRGGPRVSTRRPRPGRRLSAADRVEAHPDDPQPGADPGGDLHPGHGQGAAMKRFAAALRKEVTVQYRSHFYWVSLALVAFWMAVLSQFEVTGFAGAGRLVAALAMGNLLSTTFMFVAGLVLLERVEGSFAALVVSPLQPWQSLAVKVLTLSLLAAAETLAIVLLATRGRADLAPLVAGLVLAGATLTCFGVVAVARYESLNRFFVPCVLWMVVLTLPLLALFLPALRPALVVHPLTPGLTLIVSGLRETSSAAPLFGAVGAVVWLAAAALWGQSSFRRMGLKDAGN